MMRCGEDSGRGYFHPVVGCQREAGHKGEHQAWFEDELNGERYQRFATWPKGGDQCTTIPAERARAFAPCPSCGAACKPKDSGQCHTCDYWDERLETYAQRITFVSEGIAYSFGGVGCFGGRIFTVTFDDGEVINPARPWYNGPVPDEYRDRLKDNATITNGRPDPDPRARAY